MTMVAERLSLKHKELLFERLRQITVPIAEYSFPNLYLFRESHNYEVITGREVFVKRTSYDGHTYMMPYDLLPACICISIFFASPSRRNMIASASRKVSAVESKRIFAFESNSSSRGQ